MYHLLIAIMITFLVGCGNTTPTTNPPSSLNIAQEQNSSTISALQSTLDQNTTFNPNTTTEQNITKVISKPEKPKIPHTLTLYIHGYAQDGYRKIRTFGEDSKEAELAGIIQATGFDTTDNYDKENFKNLFAIASYYGDTAPDYYTQKDREEIEQQENGIPRYAMIMAKYAKYMMKESGATQLNIVSVSMGSLVTRYLIEYDLEGLASQKKIKKWLSLEGVIQGNVAASSDRLVDLVESFERQSPDVAQMDYDWIDSRLNEHSSYYHDIAIAFESSTKDSANKGALSTFLRFNGSFKANDGVQLVKDTQFQDKNYAQTFFHDNHYTLADNTAAWGYAATFLTSKKRLRITLEDVTLDDLHEDKTFFQNNLPADIVFQSIVHAPLAETKWGFTRPIDERLLNGKALHLFDFDKAHLSKQINLTLFDSYILPSEEALELDITPYELDFETEYGVREITGHGDHESLGRETIMIPTKAGSYPLQSREWSGHIKVEVLD